MDMTVSNYFYDNTKTGQATPLEVWIGQFGPLPQHAYPPTTTGPLTNITSYPTNSENVHIATQPSSSDVQQMGELSSSSPSAGEFIADGHISSSRYPLSSVHTHVVVTLPPVADIVKTLRSDLVYSVHNGNTGDVVRSKAEGEATSMSSSSSAPAGQISSQQMGSNSPSHADLRGISLPILFVRSVDGVGYHSGRNVTCENVFDTLDLNSTTNHSSNHNNVDNNATWLAAAQAAVQADSGMHGWTLRIL